MKRFILLSIIILTYGITLAQDVKFQAMSVYNFTRTLQWSNDYQKGNFVISFIGESDLLKELEEFSEDKKVRGEQKIVVQKVNINNIGKSHIIIISMSETSKLGQVLLSQVGKGSLIVTEEGNQTSNGAGVSFSKENGSVKYEYNTANIKKHGISVSTSFKQIGIEK